MKSRTFTLLFYALLITSFPSQLHAQVTINNGLTPQQLVQSLLGIGVTASNITFTGTINATAYFTEPSGSFHMTQGIVLTTGSPDTIPGPNNLDGAGVDNLMPGDTMLDGLTTTLTHDACILEFDFVPATDSLVFNYVFGSEEYNEFVGLGYSDVFGFFISGPGINGYRNIALVPGTTTPVSIDSINNGFAPIGTLSTGPCNNCQYYNDNLGGTILQYDGYTEVLSAGVRLQPCATYHIRLAIADAGDGIYDSGIFLEAGSFKSTAAFNIQFNGTTSPSLLHICPGACVTLSAPPLQNYLWSNGDTTQTTEACIPGFYSVSTTVGLCHAASNLVNVQSVPGPPVPVLTVSNDTAYSSVTGPSYFYAWYEDSTLIAGATTSSLLLPHSGCFRLEVTDQYGCAASSDTVCDFSVGLAGPGLSGGIQVYMPGKSQLAITIPGASQGMLTITDLSGKTVYNSGWANAERERIISCEGFSKGLYFVRLISDDKVYTRRIYIN